MSDDESAITQDERPTKRLRSSDTDLTIVVGEGEQEKTYEYHSQIMAMHSRYIDAMLATPMKEKLSMTITFPEIDPEVWEKMISYLQPVAPPPACTCEVLRVLPYYDKYEFSDGFGMCDDLLSSRLEFKVENVGSLAAYVTAAGAAYKHHLPTTKQKCKAFVKEVFRKREARLGLTQDLISDFIPVLHEETSVWTKVSAMVGPLAGNPDKETILANSFFPDILLRAIVSSDHEYNLEKKVRGIKVRNAGIAAVNGQYVRRGHLVFVKENNSVHHEMDYFISKSNNQAPADGEQAKWLLYQLQSSVQDILFTSRAHPLSTLPPRGGWKAYSQTFQAVPPILKFD
jgi:hypothetical protein